MEGLSAHHFEVSAGAGQFLNGGIPQTEWHNAVPVVITFQLGPDELGYWSTSAGRWIQDAASFDVWVGADSLATLHADLEVVI